MHEDLDVIFKCQFNQTYSLKHSFLQFFVKAIFFAIIFLAVRQISHTLSFQ